MPDFYHLSEFGIQQMGQLWISALHFSSKIGQFCVRFTSNNLKVSSKLENPNHILFIIGSSLDAGNYYYKTLSE